MKRVVIESPYRGERMTDARDRLRQQAAHRRYARACMADSLRRGEAPLASHLLYTQPGVLEDGKQLERARGIAAGMFWAELAELIVFYTDLGWTPGMKAALHEAEKAGRPTEEREIAQGRFLKQPIETHGSPIRTLDHLLAAGELGDRFWK